MWSQHNAFISFICYINILSDKYDNKFFGENISTLRLSLKNILLSSDHCCSDWFQAKPMFHWKTEKNRKNIFVLVQLFKINTLFTYGKIVFKKSIIRMRSRQSTFVSLNFDAKNDNKPFFRYSNLRSIKPWQPKYKNFHRKLRKF